MGDDRFERADEAFNAVHRQDPRQIEHDGVAQPWALVYHRRLAAWVERLQPAPGEAVRLAARCQHIRRWTIPRGDYPDGLAGYKRWRSTLARFHADEAEAILGRAGYDEATVARVRALLLKKGLKSDHEVQAFEDAICLTFMEGELSAFADKHDRDKLVRILRKTALKMSPAGLEQARTLASTLPPTVRALVGEALDVPSD